MSSTARVAGGGEVLRGTTTDVPADAPRPSTRPLPRHGSIIDGSAARGTTRRASVTTPSGARTGSQAENAVENAQRRRLVRRGSGTPLEGPLERYGHDFKPASYVL